MQRINDLIDRINRDRFRKDLKIVAYGEFPYTLIDERDLEKLIAAARRSIPRPIAEAPRDGTGIIGFHCGFWIELGYCDRKWMDDEGNEREPTEFIPVPEGK